MKWTRFFLLSVIGIGLAMASCSNDDNNTETKPNGGNESVEEGKGYLAINIRSKSITANSLKTYGQEENGTLDENAIVNVIIVLYNAQTEIVEGNFFTTVTAGNNRITKAIFTKRKEYKMLVLVNPKMTSATASVFDNEIAVGQPLSVFLNRIYNLSGDGIADFTGIGGNAGKYFFMTNPSGLVQVKTDNFYNTAEEAQTSGKAIKVYMERAVARIEFYKDNSSNLTLSNGTIGTIKWGVNNQNQKTYIKRHYAMMARKYPDGSNVTGGSVMESDGDYFNFRTPSDAGAQGQYPRVLTYAEDPNFLTFNTSDFLKITSANSTTYINNILTENSTDKIEYVLENTMDSTQQIQNRSTGILVQVEFTPDNGTTADGFYTYRGKFITASEMKSYATAANIPTDLKNLGFENAYNEAKNNGHNLNDQKPDKAFEYYTTDGYYLRFFEKSLMYYFVPIRHFTDNMENVLSGYGRFGVLRNNLYRIKLSKISNIGSPTIPDKNLPDEIDSYLSVDIDVMPWLLRDEQNVDLN